jgi:integrase
MPRRKDSAAPQRITDAWLSRFRAHPPGKVTTFFERDRTGLGVRINADATNISFLIQIRMPDKTRYRETLRPSWPGLTAAAARSAAQARGGEVALGFDPSDERKAARAEKEAAAKAGEDKLTLRILMRRWDRERLIERRKSYAVTALRALEMTFPHLLDQPVTEITRKLVRAALDNAITDRGPGAARQAGMAIRAVFGWAVGNDIIDENPFRNFKLPEAGERERALDVDEARRVYAAADELGYPCGPLIQLLLLTGMRRDEVRKLKWSEVKQDSATGDWSIELPPERTKTGRTTGKRVQPLSALAVEIIRSCPRHQGCEFVLTSDGMKARGDVTRMKATLDLAISDDGGPPIEKWVLHDLRRTIVSALAAAGHNPIVLDKLLGHSPTSLSGVAKIYQRHDFAKERRAAIEDWSQIVAGPQDGGKVVRLRTRRRA